MVCSPGTAATSICARLIASAWPTPPAPATSSMPDSSTDCCKVGLCRASSILPVLRPPSTAPRPARVEASARSKKSNGSWPRSTVTRSPPPPTEWHSPQSPYVLICWHAADLLVSAVRPFHVRGPLSLMRIYRGPVFNDACRRWKPKRNPHRAHRHLDLLFDQRASGVCQYSADSEIHATRRFQSKKLLPP